jgi:hypothetical protein
VAIPLGFAAGTAVKAVLLGVAVLVRLRRPVSGPAGSLAPPR